LKRGEGVVPLAMLARWWVCSGDPELSLTRAWIKWEGLMLMLMLLLADSMLKLDQGGERMRVEEVFDYVGEQVVWCSGSFFHSRVVASTELLSRHPGQSQDIPSIQ
jgi:hypothetical protein